MTEAERIERVAEAIRNVRLNNGGSLEQARAADAISFPAGWDAAETALRDQRSARYNGEYPDIRATWAADYLTAHKPGDKP